MEAKDFIYEFEADCDKFAVDIKRRMCKRILKTLNKTMTGEEGDDYDALGMSYVDKLSIKMQSHSLEEISCGLRDCFCEMIDAEYNALSPQERHFLNYSKCSEDNDCDIEGVKRDILSELYRMINDHYMTNKVQNYVDKYDWVSNPL